MSLNWVTLDGGRGAQPFVFLDGESILFNCQRTSLKLKPISTTSPGAVDISSPSGRLYLTNRRLIFLSEKKHELPGLSFDMESFSVPLSNIQDAHVVQPWFGPNSWKAVIVPVSNGKLNQGSYYETIVTFKDGGTFDLHEAFERIRAAQADNVDHIDQLPVYDESNNYASHAPADPQPPNDDKDLPPPYAG